MTEAQLQRGIVALARTLGWRVYHTRYSVGSDRESHGWPDLVLCRPPRLIMAELKGPRGVVQPEQAEWLALLGQCPDVETYLWWPEDLDERGDAGSPVYRVLR